MEFRQWDGGMTHVKETTDEFASFETRLSLHRNELYTSNPIVVCGDERALRRQKVVSHGEVGIDRFG